MGKIVIAVPDKNLDAAVDSLMDFFTSGEFKLENTEKELPDEPDEKEVEEDEASLEDFETEDAEGIPVVTIRYDGDDVQVADVHMPPDLDVKDLPHFVTKLTFEMMRTVVALLAASLDSDEELCTVALSALYRAAKHTLRDICEDD